MYYYNLIFLIPTALIPYHTSILTGEGWMLELLNGHPNRIWTCLGVGHDVFDKLVRVLIRDGISPSRHGMSVEEQLGIFLYTCVTGLSSQHVAERFQHSTDTITKSVSWFVCISLISDTFLKVFRRDLVLFLKSTVLHLSSMIPNREHNNLICNH